MNIPMNDLVSHLKENHVATLKLPTLLWAKFNKEDSPICETKNWHTFKFICNNGQLNDDVEKISSKKGGIYVFSISPEIIPERQRILMYIGRAQITYNENLKQRIKSYYFNFCKGLNWKRPKIQQLFNYWKDYVYCSYFEMDDNTLIKYTEADLINTLLPPCNGQIPDIQISQAVRAAF